jgi:hypothetical protein
MRGRGALRQLFDILQQLGQHQDAFDLAMYLHDDAPAKAAAEAAAPAPFIPASCDECRYLPQSENAKFHAPNATESFDYFMRRAQPSRTVSRVWAGCASNFLPLHIRITAASFTGMLQQLRLGQPLSCLNKQWNTEFVVDGCGWAVGKWVVTCTKDAIDGMWENRARHDKWRARMLLQGLPREADASPRRPFHYMRLRFGLPQRRRCGAGPRGVTQKLGVAERIPFIRDAETYVRTATGRPPSEDEHWFEE